MPSCALMLKFEWPLILPDDPAVEKLSKATRDIAQYVVEIAKDVGLVEGLSPLEGGVTVHLACHARAHEYGGKGRRNAASASRYQGTGHRTVLSVTAGPGG